MMPVVHDVAWMRQFRRRLVAWFRRHARDLPWRRTRDPYHVWVSEIMLQQTQVATVIPYYQRFLAEFPTIGDLAAAREDRVLRCWEGLGYYRRARQLHRAAGLIVEQHGGRFPSQLEEVLALPGIGRYTAGAILSIAHDARLPILEANTIRLFSRLLALSADPSQRDVQQQLWEFATRILPASRTGEFNQALMELGSLVCKPRQPACADCPLASLCPTRASGKQHEIPRLKKNVRWELRHEACVTVWRGERLLVRQCGPDERWAGLWDFPRFPVTDQEDRELQLIAGVRQQCGVSIAPGQLLTTIKHGVTRFRITLDCHHARWCSGKPTGSGVQWVKLTDLDELPLNRTARRISRLLVSQFRAGSPGNNSQTFM